MPYRVHEGHDEVIGSINVGGGTGEHAQFQVKANVSKGGRQLVVKLADGTAHRANFKFTK